MDHALREVQFLQILPNPLIPSNFGSASTPPPLHLEGFKTTLTGSVVCLLFTCPNHLNLPSFILSDILATSNISLKTSFLIRSNLVWPHIHLSILISATSILRACTSLMAQHSVPYNIAGLIATL
ncbi:hypothetical protein HanHA300_Chr04g0115741 [Helianthus annuus]|nr:hypothetical protein HanHA300_Chr04g0115741 [Helianthus annuus]KAJ0595129.1 hypothetical protein HanHA89_Chr04g0127921 [Helianthus annuus]KAJ0755814.1 hypothetical protein HanLR1_Chr04g0120061 [Helianthus annuus]